MTSYDVIIIGAGAAGLMCAAIAAGRGRRVLMLEHTSAFGAKIVISGGGRCNFTNLQIAPDRFISDNPHFAKSALARYTQQDFIALVRKHAIPFYEKKLGQLFCEGAGAAKRIVAMLVAEAQGAGAELRTGVSVSSIESGRPFRLTTTAGDFTAASVVLATGGLSIPKLGASDFSYRMAQRFGLTLTEIRPGLVPVTVGEAELQRFAPLAGVSAPAIARAARGPAFEEAFLFTHQGLSGPAVLQASSYWRMGEPLVLDLIPDADAAAWLRERKRARPKASLATALGERLPARLADMLAAGDHAPLADWKDRDLDAVAARLRRFDVMPSGTEGYAKAEVTVGGVGTANLDQKTMMAKSVPGLFVIGEAVDVTGWLGGYNFQWAWSSGYAAGLAA